MASRTQLRLAQLTGSLDDTKARASNINETSLQGVLDHVVASIQRIHGGSVFQDQEAGHFDQNLHITGSGIDFSAASTLETAAGGLTLKGASDLGLSAADASDIIFQAGSTDVLTLGVTAAGDQTFTANIQDQDLIFQVNDGGSPTEVMRLDGDVSALLVASGKEVRFGGAGTHIDGDGSTLSVAGNTNFANDVTITGDLTVNGDTVTLDTTNKSIQDQLIILNSGSAADPTKQDVGIIFAQPDVSRVLYVDDSDSSKFVFATTYTSGTATGANAVTKVANADVVMGALETSGVTNSALTDNRVVIAGSSGVLEDDANLTFDGADLQLANNIGLVFSTDDAEKIESDGTDLTINSGGDINLTATADVNLPANIGLTFGDDGEKIEGDGTNLTVASSANLTLDAEDKVKLDTINGTGLYLGNTQYGLLSGSVAGAQSDALVISSSEGINLVLDSNGGYVNLAMGAFDQASAVFDISTAGTFNISAGQEAQFHLQLNTNQQHKLSGSIQLDNGASAGAIIFEESSSTGNDRTLTLDIPDLDATYTLTLPADKGTTGQVLKLADGNGNLEFGDPTGDLARFAYKATAAVAAGNVDFGSSKTSGISALAVGTANLNITKAASDLNNALEVYVNGQLLVSGSDGGADTDYTFIDADTLKFAFGLEADDIIQIIQR